MKKVYLLIFLITLLHANHLFAQKYNWIRTYTPSNFNNLKQFVKISDDQVIVTGLFQNSISFGTTVLTNQINATSIYVASYDTSGVFQWAVKGGSNTSSEEIDGLEVDEFGNIYIIGSYLTSTTWGTLTLSAQGSSSSFFKRESFLVKLDSAGTPQWIEGFYNPTTALPSDFLKQISIADSSIFVLGSLQRDLRVTNSSLTLNQSANPIRDNVFLAKFDLNGTLNNFEKIITATNNGTANITDVEAIDSNSYYLAGTFGSGFHFGSNNRTFSNPNSSFAFVITKFTNDSCDWLTNSTSTSSFFGSFNVQLEISKDNDLWFAGAYSNNFTYLSRTLQNITFGVPEWFYGKLNTSGGLRDIERSVTKSIDIQDIAENSLGELLITGSYIDSITINNKKTFSSGSSDLLILSVDSAYNENWYQTGGGASGDFSFGIVSGNSDAAYVLGNYQGLSQFGSTFLTAPTNRTSSILFKIGECENGQTPLTFNGDTNLCVGQSVRIVADPPSTSTFQWLRNSSPLAGEVFRDLTVTSTGDYQVIVNADGCADTSRFIPVQVDTIPTVTFTAVDTICRTADSIILRGGVPSGGIYSGRGVISDSIFDPAIAGIGNTTIKYVFANGGCSDSAEATIYVNPSPTVFFAQPADICINSAPITLINAFPPGGTFSGLGVSGGQFDPSLTNGGSVPITYTFTDGNGCSSEVTQNIQVDTLETASLSILPDLCENGSIYTFSEGIPAGGFYEGIGVNNSTFDPSISGVGTFTVSYIISNQCGNDTASQTITVNPLPTVNFPPLSDVCEGSPAITLNAATPAGGTYSGTGVTGTSFNPVTAGVGTFKIFYDFIDTNNCSARDSSSITVNPLPVVSISNDTTICNGSSVTLTASGGASYLWSDNSTTSSITVSPIATTKYFVTVTSAQNCESKDSVIVNVNDLPIAAISGNTTICEGSSTTLTASGGTSYLWNTSEVSSSITVSPMLNSTFTVTVTDGNGCSATTSQLVTVNPLPTVNFPPLADVCEGSPVITLNAATPAGGTYSGTGVTGSSFNPTAAGVGTFKIFYDFTDGNNCSARDSSSITVNPLPFVSISNDTTICNGSSVTLTASGGASYLWSDNSTTPSITVSPTTTTKYFVTVTSAENCDSISSVNVTVNFPTSGTDVQTACDSYTWIDGITYTASTNTPVFTLTNAANCDSVVTLNLTINSTARDTINLVECDSYTWSSNNQTYTASGVYSDTLVGSAANGCDSISSINLTINNSSASNEFITACNSYTWPLNGITYTSSTNTPTVTLTNAIGCDSVITLNLTINSTARDTVAIASCDSFTWISNNQTYTASGIYSDTLIAGAANGCDSISSINLTINLPTTGTDIQTACDSYTWIDGITYTASTNTPVFTLTNAANCDSVVTLNLTINSTARDTTNLVECDTYTWPSNNQTYTVSGVYSDTLAGSAANGCDSISSINLTINNSSASNEFITACNSYTWPLNGITYTSSTNTPTVTLTNAIGCDSVITLNLTINSTARDTVAIASCDSFTWLSNNQTYTASGIYSDTLIAGAANGCDSISSINLTINLPSTGTDIQTACDSYTWIDGITYTASTNTPVFTLTNAANCDSVVTLNLTIGSLVRDTTNLVECGSYTWPSNNQTYTASGVYSDTLAGSAANGCDSISSINLTINNSSASNEFITACNSYTWPLNGITYTSSTNTPTVTLTNTIGCDSVITLNLTINSTARDTVAIASCDSFTWISNNQTYTASGIYSDTLIAGAANGCDSISSINLTINLPTTGTDIQTACDSYTWIDGITYNASTNTPVFTLTNAANCDSVVTLNLTINSTARDTTNLVECDTYTWPSNNQTYTVSGVYSDTLAGSAANGCDSISSINLTINNSSASNEFITACNSYTWPLNGITYTSSTNTPTVTLTNAIGCDSVITLNLTINSTARDTVAIASCDSFTWLSNNQTYTASGIYSDTLVAGAANGCDSISSINLTINLPTTGTDIQTACDSYTWIDGITYTASTNTPVFTLTNAANCDSVVTLNLTIGSLVRDTTNLVECGSYTWPSNNQTYTASGVYSDTLAGSAANGCDSISSINLTININPIANAGPDLTNTTDDPIQLQSSTVNASTILWIPSEGLDNDTIEQPLANPNNSTEYILNVTSSEGCLVSDTMFLTINRGQEIEIRTLFSPNGDGKNDTWTVDRPKLLQGCQVVVYNRNGKEVYSTNNFSNDWDGTSGGQDLPEATYYYIIECDDGKIYKGPVTIIRKKR